MYAPLNDEFQPVELSVLKSELVPRVVVVRHSLVGVLTIKCDGLKEEARTLSCIPCHDLQCVAWVEFPNIPILFAVQFQSRFLGPSSIDLDR